MNIANPENWEVFALGYLLVVFRAAALISMFPVFGEMSIPLRVKFAVIVGITVIVQPLVDFPMFDAQLNATWLIWIVGEIGIGLWFGLLIRVFVFCLQTAGSIAAQSTSLSQILGSAGVEPLPAMGHVITMAGLTLALALGLHVSAVEYLIGSYMLFPIGQLPDLEAVAQSIVKQIASGFQLAFALAAPFFILSLLYNLTLGVINRAMPQLMVAFVGAPVITAGALFLLTISIPLILGTWVRALFGFLASGQLN